jgi:hypothetical protein
MNSVIDELPLDECLRRLRAAIVGRIAVIERGFPLVIPVNYRTVETNDRTRLVVRTRPGNLLDRASMAVALEIDGIDPAHHQGWSVLVRGTLHHVDLEVFNLEARFDPQPWIETERDSWLLIAPFAITGRQLRPPEFEWARRHAAPPARHDAAAIFADDSTTQTSTPGSRSEGKTLRHVRVATDDRLVAAEAGDRN